jgi:hypothetical protein
MSSYRQFRRRTIRRVAIGFALAAIVAPSAQAMRPVGHPYGSNSGAGQSAEVVLAARQAYGELGQFSGAGLATASTYGELHRFPDAGLGPSPIDIRNVRPTIWGGPSAAVVEADNWTAIYHPSGHPQPSGLPQYSIDGPRTAPNAVVRPAEPVLYGNRGGRVPPRYPVAIAPSEGADVTWTGAGVAIAIGVVALAALAGALVFGGSRRRGTLQGA